MTEAELLIIKEALNFDGILVQFRAGEDPAPERLNALLSALKTVAAQPSRRSERAIDRELACALYLLSFHASGLIDARKGRWSEAVDELMPLIYEQIDRIFGVFD